jgi:hypothetical protein
MFFSEEKNQKTFMSLAWVTAASPIIPPGSKSFLLLFFKKEVLPSAVP